MLRSFFQIDVTQVRANAFASRTLSVHIVTNALATIGALLMARAVCPVIVDVAPIQPIATWKTASAIVNPVSVEINAISALRVTGI